MEGVASRQHESLVLLSVVAALATVGPAGSA